MSVNVTPATPVLIMKSVDRNSSPAASVTASEKANIISPETLPAMPPPPADVTSLRTNVGPALSVRIVGVTPCINSPTSVCLGPPI